MTYPAGGLQVSHCAGRDRRDAAVSAGVYGWSRFTVETNMTKTTLADRILQIAQDYERECEQKLQVAKAETAQLRQLLIRLESDGEATRNALAQARDELIKAQKELEKLSSDAYRMADEALGARLSKLGSVHADTMMREACVVLEDRLRTAGGARSSLHGINLVDAVLTPGKEKLSFSEHPAEQEGVRMLFRGAMQFIRNPPMHKLIEYPEGMAQLLIRLIDSLLLLLKEGEPPETDEVTVADVRRMLTRRPVSEGQRALFRALYSAGDEGIALSSLAKAIRRSPSQLGGILGALGRRISTTKGLEGKGATEVVINYSKTDKGEWVYTIRPVLRKALEAEGIV
jgi:predicted transcriptional regulator with HTH domain